MQNNYQHCSVTLSFLDSGILSNAKLNNTLNIIILSFPFKYELRQWMMRAAINSWRVILHVINAVIFMTSRRTLGGESVGALQDVRDI